MSWRVIAQADIEGKFTPAELGMLRAAQNSNTQLATRLTDCINEFNSALSGAGYPVLAGYTVDLFRNYVINRTVWQWLMDFPKLAQFKTDERKQADRDAQRALERITTRSYGDIEPPPGTDITTGNWNSESKIIGRMHPVPPPISQFTWNAQAYANPNAPSDNPTTQSPGVPDPPLNIQAVGGDGFVVLTWLPVYQLGVTYSVYKGTTQGKESETPIATGLTVTNFTDMAVTNGVQYFYVVSSVLPGIVDEGDSLEVSVTPQAGVLP